MRVAFSTLALRKALLIWNSNWKIRSGGLWKFYDTEGRETRIDHLCAKSEITKFGVKVSFHLIYGFA